MRRALTVTLLCLAASAALADERATTKEAEAMVHKAAQYLKANGREKALATFNDPKGPFTYRDLYIFVLDGNVVTRAHGARKDFVGQDFSDKKDVDGKLFARELVRVATAGGKGWVEYKFQNPSTGKVEQKVAYAEKVDDLIVGCGAYLK